VPVCSSDFQIIGFQSIKMIQGLEGDFLFSLVYDWMKY
jgi:hypothetical protein